MMRESTDLYQREPIEPRFSVFLMSSFSCFLHALTQYSLKYTAILSNSAGTRDDKDYRDAQFIEESLGIAVIKHEEKKPGGLNELMQHFEGITDPATVCVVGDRILTDVVFGNLYGYVLEICFGCRFVHGLPAGIVWLCSRHGINGMPRLDLNFHFVPSFSHCTAICFGVMIMCRLFCGI
jgi:Mitochondrial PGP phosphatase